MPHGYVGQRSRKRRRNYLLFLFFILLIGLITYFSFSNNNIDEEIVGINNNALQKEDDISVKNIEIKQFEAQQKLKLRDNLISSFKSQIKNLEKNQDELINTIKQMNLENEKNNLISNKIQKNNRGEIEQLQKIINELNKEIKKLNKEIKIINDSYFSLKNENAKINKLKGIVENNNNTLQLQRDIAVKNIENLKQILIEKDKLINEKDKLIKEMKDKIHH